MAGILGKKLGMTNVFDEQGRAVPVTVIEAGPCFVLSIKTKEKDGYSSVLLGYEDKNLKKVRKPQKKFFEKIKIAPKKFVKEMRSEKESPYRVGDTIGAGIFKNGDFVDVTGTTIGKGFQGGMKRWNWVGGEKGHGSMFHRAPGSIGASSFPSRVFKGHHMPGHMGAVRQTTQNLRVISVDEEKNLLVVKGAAPGHKGSFLIVRHAKKKPPKEASSGKKEKNEGKG